MTLKKKTVVIVGAGPAGLTAGIEFLKNENFSVNLIEKDNTVGGLAKTVSYKDYKYDIGPHHYITDSKKIESWWKSFFLKEFITLHRFTRIYYKNHFFHYPLEPINVLKGLNIFECIICVTSYLKARLFPYKNPKNFKEWIINSFGKRLFNIFFKTYTEKLWEIPCENISADWATQRIKTFSLSKAIFYAFFGQFFRKNTPRTIQKNFLYPIKGSGSFWEKVAVKLNSSRSGAIKLNEEVISIKHLQNKITTIFTKNTKIKNQTTLKLNQYKCDYFLSTMPLRDLIARMDPLPPKKITFAAKRLKYRALSIVNFIIDKKNVCPDHWLYIHEKNLKLVRIGNMNNFSIKLLPNAEHTALSLEYFSFTTDNFWKIPDSELIDLAKNELEKIGLVKKSQILDGMVLKIADAYPVYELNYKEDLNLVLDYLTKFKNLKLIGRNGAHQYNNMDTAMLSAMKAVNEIIMEKTEQTMHNKRQISTSI